MSGCLLDIQCPSPRFRILFMTGHNLLQLALTSITRSSLQHLGLQPSPSCTGGRCRSPCSYCVDMHNSSLAVLCSLCRR
jgi:hypothetical protein